MDPQQSPSERAATRPPRLLSLDVLRGITMALMILVNNAGDANVSYAQLHHSLWNGCTLTDLVFPMFLFIVGASITLAFANRLKRGASRASIVRQILRRAALIFLIGLFLNGFPYFHLANLRYCGVLQRIAVCYALAGLIYLFGGVPLAASIACIAIVLYWWLLTHVAVPGFGIPGHNIPVLDPMGNLPAWLDRHLIPVAHRYRHTFYDPEGILSTVTALATTLIGVLAGAWLRTSRSPRTKAAAAFLVGVLLLCGGLLWSHSFPLNKRLWTSSYVLLTAGISTLALAGLYWCIDGPLQIRRGLTPWKVFGTNALTAYVFSEVLASTLSSIHMPRGENLQQYLYHWIPQFLGTPAFVSLLYSLLFIGICFLPVLYLYKRKIVVKI